jgi:hypothetical protein
MNKGLVAAQLRHLFEGLGVPDAHVVVEALARASSKFMASY